VGSLNISICAKIIGVIIHRTSAICVYRTIHIHTNQGGSNSEESIATDRAGSGDITILKHRAGVRFKHMVIATNCCNSGDSGVPNIERSV